MKPIRRQSLQLAARSVIALVLTTGTLFAGAPGRGSTQGSGKPAGEEEPYSLTHRGGRSESPFPNPEEQPLLELAPLPDLEFFKDRISTGAPGSSGVMAPGDQVMIEGAVTNSGKGASPACKVDYVLRRLTKFGTLGDPSLSPALHVSISDVPALQSGGQAPLGPLGKHFFTLPGVLSSGLWQIEVWIDPNNEVSEESNMNNRAPAGIIAVHNSRSPNHLLGPKDKPGTTPGGNFGATTTNGFGGLGSATRVAVGPMAGPASVARGAAVNSYPAAVAVCRPAPALGFPGTMAVPGARTAPDYRHTASPR